MLYYLLLALGGFLAVFFLRTFRLRLYRLAEDSLALLNVLLGSEEDDIKLEQMQKATSRTLISLLTGVALLLIAALIIGLPYLAADVMPSILPQAPSALWEIIAISVGASIPFFISLKRTPHNYSELSVLLHRLILNNYNIGLRLFKREARRAARKGISPKNEFLIVSGLARAGTTSMMNKLNDLPEFSSLNYANMPFLLSPGLWSRIYRPKADMELERSHKDGVTMNLRSAEALEEYFFKAISADSYIKVDGLYEYSLSEDDYENYLSYQAVVRANSSTYLAKNNNFMLRYRSLRKHNQRFVLVLLFRHPLLHAASLLEKHRQYQDLQRQDPFVLEYMNWLGHHEFGLNQKPFVFEGQSAPEGNKNGLDYWLNIWINYYENALNVQDENFLIVDYEEFCSNPESILRMVTAQLGIMSDVQAQEAYINRREVQEDYSADLLNKALELYKQLVSRTQIR